MSWTWIIIGVAVALLVLFLLFYAVVVWQTLHDPIEQAHWKMLVSNIKYDKAAKLRASGEDSP